MSETGLAFLCIIKQVNAERRQIATYAYYKASRFNPFDSLLGTIIIIPVIQMEKANLREVK